MSLMYCRRCSGLLVPPLQVNGPIGKRISINVSSPENRNEITHPWTGTDYGCKREKKGDRRNLEIGRSKTQIGLVLSVAAVYDRRVYGDSIQTCTSRVTI